MFIFMFFFLVFFFKQKTAYEMRISDWSSDVCSSDLFDPDEPDFISNFVHGHMRYRLQALPFADDLAYYRDVGRGVSIQWLNLSDAEATRLASALAENAKPENARYGYDYFTDN